MSVFDDPQTRQPMIIHTDGLGATPRRKCSEVSGHLGVQRLPVALVDPPYRHDGLIARRPVSFGADTLVAKADRLMQQLDERISVAPGTRAVLPSGTDAEMVDVPGEFRALPYESFRFRPEEHTS